MRKLQDDGLLERFDTAGFADKVLEYGEARLALLDGDDADDASVLDKAAVVTSILPGIGCAVQLAADEVERGHAAHRVLSENATIAAAQDQGDAGADVGAHVRPELKRQICATIAEAKHQLHVRLEGIALNHTAKLEREFKNQFLDEWFKAGTSPSPILGVTIPDLPHVTKHIQEQVDKARNTPPASV